jgi:hypothetical protein
METLDRIPLELNTAELLNRMRLRKESKTFEDATQELVERARPIARPRALYSICYVEHKGEDSVSLDGTVFTSRVLAKNLEKAERVFPYVVTCGRELDEIQIPSSDLVKYYCWEEIKALAMNTARRYLNDYLTSKYALGQMSRMAPGSLNDWPVTQQAQLFSLLGDVEAQIGVRLTDSFLMIPLKSVSGIYFPTEVRFESCQLCQRPVCSGRRAPYDPELAREYGVDATAESPH